jgi:cell division septal protein FtsQ
MGLTTEGLLIGSEKSTARGKKRIRVVLLALIVVLFSLLLLRLGMHQGLSVVLPVKKVQINGNRYVSAGEIVRLLHIDTPTSMLLLDRVKAVERIQSDRRIDRAAVAKIYPDTLRIYIMEKKAAAVIVSGGKTYAVSADGIVLSTAKDADFSAYPLITLNSIHDDIKTGNEIRNIVVKNLIGALYAFKKEYPEFSARIERAAVDDSGAHLILQEFRVYLGTDITLQKMVRLRALVYVLEDSGDFDVQGGGMTDIDMSFSHAAVRRENSDGL